ncbi:MAG: hypothetical protein M3Y22_00670 [Pseudomonadota bacterium]|nr:hypothetical protein [Pseudomonadota bacterium]
MRIIDFGLEEAFVGRARVWQAMQITRKPAARRIKQSEWTSAGYVINTVLVHDTLGLNTRSIVEFRRLCTHPLVRVARQKLRGHRVHGGNEDQGGGAE